ncbi:odorant receptor 98a-like [Drosophila willistoni]|uniref:odorant receptor 98a-like n=1 Tax=Drosophila willistoni TaxID=7260 RepID=UPI001F0813FA|nr:odorant receptor 98a-like [Drosophila willistoni]
MIFKVLRNPGPQDKKSSADAFVYFEYGMTVAGLLPPSKGRKLYMMFRGLVIMWSVIYLPFGMMMGCIKDFKNFSPGEFLALIGNVMNVVGCSLKILGFYIHLSQYHKAKKVIIRMDEFFLIVDVFNIICCLMLRAHLEILRHRVQKFRTDPEETEKESYDELVKCIEQHKLILEYADLVRSLFSFNTFIQFILIGTMLGCTLVNLLFFSDFWTGLSCCIYIIGLMAQTFPFCYNCDLIIDDCNKLALTLFHSNWTGSSRRYKSTLIQFIHNAQKPIIFTAGSIFPICMQSNIQVAKLAFSVVTFIKQMNIADKLSKKLNIQSYWKIQKSNVVNALTNNKINYTNLHIRSD